VPDLRTGPTVAALAALFVTPVLLQSGAVARLVLLTDGQTPVTVTHGDSRLETPVPGITSTACGVDP
jgi:hypothetical protein